MKVDLWARTVTAVLRWLGVATVAFGIGGSAWTAIVYVRVQLGWGIVARDACCSNLGTAALGAILGSMFLVLVGAILVLLGRLLEGGRVPVRRRHAGWLRWLPGALVLYAVCVFALTAVLAANARELGDAAGGIVSFCVLAFLGLMLVASGIYRSGEADASAGDR